MAQAPRKNTLEMTAQDCEEPLYAWGRGYALGWQEGAIMFASVKRYDDGNRSLNVQWGCASTEVGRGVKIDQRTYVPSKKLEELLAVVQPDAVGKPGSIDLDAWRNRRFSVEVGEERDRNASAKAGRDVLRPTVKAVALLAAAAPPTTPTAGAFA